MNMLERHQRRCLTPTACCRALYHCNYCDKDISASVRIKCAVCADFDLCLECFRCARRPLNLGSSLGSRHQLAPRLHSAQIRQHKLLMANTGNACCRLLVALGHWFRTRPTHLARAGLLVIMAVCARRLRVVCSVRSHCSVGVEITPHKQDHAYRVVDDLSFPLFHPSWGVRTRQSRRKMTSTFSAWSLSMT